MPAFFSTSAYERLRASDAIFSATSGMRYTSRLDGDLRRITVVNGAGRPDGSERFKVRGLHSGDPRVFAGGVAEISVYLDRAVRELYAAPPSNSPAREALQWFAPAPADGFGAADDGFESGPGLDDGFGELKIDEPAPEAVFDLTKYATGPAARAAISLQPSHARAGFDAKAIFAASQPFQVRPAQGNGLLAETAATQTQWASAWDRMFASHGQNPVWIHFLQAVWAESEKYVGAWTPNSLATIVPAAQRYIRAGGLPEPVWSEMVALICNSVLEAQGKRAIFSA